ncbi:hypothetical protein C8R44DRAFT_886354 [Mycena epipterygia]|nr:hypothetical protein C8R44DRAFT_886354 [Mycena epipterygia]
MDSRRTTQNGSIERGYRDESAAAKLWAVYISEAEKYDKALVESWRSDMDGLLIFAGLFSASLTAFLIESYKTLSPDQAELTIDILAQISRQLSVSGNGSSMEFAMPGAFTPSASSLACNTLWFLSLGLSLSCALIATLVEQWARDFIQKTEMRPSPIIRARIFSYLYYGLRRFNMHAVVELIPLLLHLSLILFFAGLVAFLQPVNIAMAAVAAALLVVILSVYSYLTILPIFHSDCPYRTPLSPVSRYAFLRISSLRRPSILRGKAPDGESGAFSPASADSKISTLIEVMTHHATTDSPERADRDCRALIWTVKSLTDDDELEPFVEAIPDVIWGSTGRRRLYDEQINALLRHPEVRLVDRVESLLCSSQSSLLAADLRRHRQICCFKAIWAISCLEVDLQSPHRFPFQRWEGVPKVVEPRVKSYLLSAQWLARFNLERSEIADSTNHSFPLKPWYKARLESISTRIMLAYLEESSTLDFSPYELLRTCEMMRQHTLMLSENHNLHIRLAFATIISERHMERLREHPEMHHIDTIVRILLSVWQSAPDLPHDDSSPFFTESLLKYIGSRDADESLTVGLGSCNHTKLSSSITRHLKTNITRDPQYFRYMWRLCSFYARNSQQLPTIDGSTVIAVQDAAPSEIGQSIAALMELLMLKSLPQEELPASPPNSHYYDSAWDAARSETHCLILIDFMEDCASPDLPYRAAETLHYLLDPASWLCSRMKRTIQRRFGSALWGLTNVTDGQGSVTSRADLIQIVAYSVFGPQGFRLHFDDPEALRTILLTLDFCKVEVNFAQLIEKLRGDYELAILRGGGTEYQHRDQA